DSGSRLHRDADRTEDRIAAGGAAGTACKLARSAVVTGTRQQTGRKGRAAWAAPVLVCAAVSLSACGDIARFQTPGPTASISPAKPNRTVAQTPASEREHERILAAYGGIYDDPKLEALIGKTVDRLVAASDKPEQAYRVTILNSGAVNAFALPTGQLYV